MSCSFVLMSCGYESSRYNEIQSGQDSERVSRLIVAVL
jgi:hypothetical protein